MRLRSDIARAAGVVVFALCIAAPPAEAANLISNGSFELGLASWSTSGFTLQGYDYGVDSQAQDGSNAFYGGGIESLGFLSQSFASLAGQRYDIDFWLASDGFLPNRFQLLVNGQVLLDREDILIQPYGAIHAAFTAGGSSTQLQFGFRDDAGRLHLDNVSVSAIPEPTTMALLSLGLGALAVRRRQLKAGQDRTSTL